MLKNIISYQLFTLYKFIGEKPRAFLTNPPKMTCETSFSSEQNTVIQGHIPAKVGNHIG